MGRETVDGAALSECSFCEQASFRAMHAEQDARLEHVLGEKTARGVSEGNSVAGWQVWEFSSFSEDKTPRCHGHEDEFDPREGYKCGRLGTDGPGAWTWRS